MADRRITHAQIKKVRDVLIAKQGGSCPLCGGAFKGNKSKQPALDHCHVKGNVRGVLCIWCNGREGKIFNLARTAHKDDPVGWLRRLADYLELHRVSQHGLRHPVHKTEVEKRLDRNKKARERRAKCKT